jgi:hypothetical protein
MNVVALYRLLIPAVKTFRLMACLVALLALSPLVHAQIVVDTSEEVMEAPPVETTDHGGTKIGTIPSPLLFRAVPDSTVRRFKNEKDFEYANDPEYWDIEHEEALKRKREQEQREQELKAERQEYKKGFWDYFYTLFSGNTIRIITYFLLSAFFLFVIYRIMVVNKLFLFYHSKKAKVSDGGGEVIDIENDNLDEKIRKAAQTGEHRQAVRFMYLKTLQLLNERQWIKYHVDATNYEYVIQMSKHKLGDDFGFLTRIYDYVWYGEFSLTQEQFDLVYNNFSHFYNAVNA